MGESSTRIMPPWRPPKRFLKFCTRMHRLFVTVRNDHSFKRQVQHRSKSGQFTLLMSGSTVPDSKFSVPFCQRVPEDDNAMLRQPQWGLQSSPAIIQRDQSTRQYAVSNDRFQLRIRDIVWKEEHWTISPNIIPTCEQVDVADMIWHRYYCRGWRILVKPFPQTNIVQYGSERIQHQSLLI